MYTGATFDSSGQSFSLQYESLTYLGGWQRAGRSISDRMSYRNNYMCNTQKQINIYFVYMRSNFFIIVVYIIFLLFAFYIYQISQCAILLMLTQFQTHKQTPLFTNLESRIQLSRYMYKEKLITKPLSLSLSELKYYQNWSNELQR